MLTAYNDQLRALAKRKNVMLIDAAEKLPKNPAYFYDQIHYNEAGSRAMAALMASELIPILAREGSVRSGCL
jgi:lysophospholipase L1-like esterase